MKRPLVIYPWLIAIYPVVFLYAHNPGEMKLSYIFLLLGVSLGLTFFMWILFGLWLKDRDKAGLATSICIFFLLTYGHFYGLLEKQTLFVPRHESLIAGMLLISGTCIYFIHRARSGLITFTKVLNIAASVLIAINTFSMISYQIKLAQTAQPGNDKAESETLILSSFPGLLEPVAQASPAQSRANEPVVQLLSTQSNPNESAVEQGGQKLPDIYFIILDEYASPDVIKEYYDYDNESFIRSLEAKGFFVARNSRTHYNDTVKSISSVLNMEFTPKDESAWITYQRIPSNRVVSQLQSLGYEYVYFGQWFELGRYEVKADAYFNYYKEALVLPGTADLWNSFWKTTALTFFEQIPGIDDKYYREGLVRTLDHLEKVPEMEGQKFVFAHIIVPHQPYVFGPNGESIDSAYRQLHPKESYLGQYIFITQEIDKVVGEILQKSAIDPIIIIQSDHGPKTVPEWDRILNACHLPGNERQILDDAVSPVNTFRIIFNQYFNANYELLDNPGN